MDDIDPIVLRIQTLVLIWYGAELSDVLDATKLPSLVMLTNAILA